MEEKFVKLTHAVYKLLDFLPEGEPLKNRAKEKALSVMDGLFLISEKNKNALAEDIEILQAYLNLAKMHGWIDNVNYLIISNEYKNLNLQNHSPVISAKAEIQSKNDISERQGPPSSEITARQGKILELLKEKDKAQVSDINKLLPEVTKRTIRRDVDDLLKRGRVVRTGEWNQVFYKIG